MSVSLDLGLAVVTREFSVPVADGFIYVSGGDIERGLAAPLSDLVTVVVEVASGGFAIAGESGESTVCDGEALAAVLRPHTPNGSELRLWLSWPEDSSFWARLRRNVWELAESMGVVVWSPPEGGRVDVVAGCGDLGCTVAGEPVAWQAYHPRTQRRLRFTCDGDGRLVPTGGLTFVCRQLEDGSFMMHLPVLEDGRLAAYCFDGSRYPLGPRELYRLVYECGWRDEPITLADEVGSVQFALLGDYLDDIASALGRRLPISARGVATHAPEVRARHVTSNRPRSLARWRSLVDQVSDLLVELPSLQTQCRTMVCADPHGTVDLLTSWYDLHQQLVEARHAPAIRAVWAARSTLDTDLTDDELRDASARADSLARARQSLTMYLDAARLASAVRVAAPGMGSMIDARWDGHLRSVSNIALAHLDPSDPDQARQMRGLAQAISGLAMAPDPGADFPGSLDHPRVQLRCYVERIAAGAVGGLAPFAPVPATDAETVEPDGPVQPPTARQIQPPLVVADAVPDEEAEFDPYELQFGPDPTKTVEWTRSAVFLARPRLVQTGRRTKPHGLPWLPQAVQVNDHEFDLYIESRWPAEQAAESGIPSSRMFLVGHVDPSPTRAPYEIRIRVGRHGAVDVPATGVAPPPELRNEVCAKDAYVVPAAWLDQCQIVLDSGCVPATVWCTGATHGIEGLPEIGQAWPHTMRGSLRAYALVPAAGSDASWVRLRRRPPKITNRRLVEVRVSKRLVIDLARLSARMPALPAVRTILPDLRSQGARCILPRQEFAQALAVRAFEADSRRWRPAPLGRGLSFAAVVASAQEAPPSAPSTSPSTSRSESTVE
jgi:hypothetical protein